MTRHRGDLMRDVLLAVVCLGFPVAAVGAVIAVQSSQQASHRAHQSSQQAVQNWNAVNQLARQVRSLGGVPVVQPSSLPGPKGDPGPGPSDTQVALAVASYCAGRAGCSPTVAQVAAAVRTYCHGATCTGPAGKPGKNATGDPGAQGPPPTDDQVAAAVAAYCDTHGECRGPAGADATGAPGPAGPSGATGPAGEPPTSWQYTDTLGRLKECDRTVPFDPAAPTYVCALVTVTPTPTPTPTGTP